MCWELKMFYRKRSDFCVPLWKARYLQHNAAVRAIVPQEQLLVHKVKVCNARNMENPNSYDIGWWWLGATVQFLGQTYPWHSMASWKQVPGPIFIDSKQSVTFLLRAGSGKGNIAVQYAEFEVFRRGNFEAATSILLLTSLAAGIVTACYLKRP